MSEEKKPVPTSGQATPTTSAGFRKGAHTALLAYQSDESMSDNILIPFGVNWGAPGLNFVSLDHAIWFHQAVDLDADLGADLGTRIWGHPWI